ncbi:MAG: MlaD family protein [Pacificimonas sp.]
METKSSHVLVGGVALLLLVALFGFVLWIAKFDTGTEEQYDVFFTSVSGLTNGSSVSYSGVPVGTVKTIAIMPDSPEFVRVRIAVSGDTPVLEGTTATLSSVGFTGVAIVSLEGAVKGAPPIAEPGPFGEPVIPTAPGTIDSLLNAAPELLDNVSQLTEQLTLLMSPENQESITSILNSSARVSEAIASRDQDIAATVTEARAAVANMSKAANEFSRVAGSTADLLDAEGRPLMADLRATLQRTNATLIEVEATAAAARGGVETVTTQTLPEVSLLVRDLREASASLGAITAKLDEDPAGALLGGRTLPTYEPETEE